MERRKGLTKEENLMEDLTDLRIWIKDSIEIDPDSIDFYQNIIDETFEKLFDFRYNDDSQNKK
jgi:hypothetical protein